VLLCFWVPEVDSKTIADGFDKTCVLASVSFSKQRFTFVSHSLDKGVILRYLFFLNDYLGQCSPTFFYFLFFFLNKVGPGFD
jgi:hypothetical protein